MNFKLGDKVTFTKSLSKQSGYGVKMDNYTEDQKIKLDDYQDRVDATIIYELEESSC